MSSRSWILALLLLSCSRRTERAAPAGTVLIPAGTFTMGTDRGMFFEGPTHEETVRGFFLDTHEVTNAAFAKFVSATGYVTMAEKVGESSVFDVEAHQWTVVPNATWKAPRGAGTHASDRDPVVHIAWADADAYCHFIGGRLPTEKEWERAARGGIDSARFPWGDDEIKGDDGSYRANVWQGRFPDHDDGSDGFRGVAPVGSFAPNAFGLFDMAGNVWEWTDAFFDTSKEERVIRGGSWLCSASHCIGYRSAARGKAVAKDGTNHIGFRCARDL